jgi:hypothetical protein
MTVKRIKNYSSLVRTLIPVNLQLFALGPEDMVELKGLGEAGHVFLLFRKKSIRQKSSEDH